MLAKERHLKILDIVNANRTIKVNELSKILNVTGETIRRDLNILEKDGKLNRIHGGAYISEKENNETPFYEREITNIVQKKQIAKTAINYIKENDQIILDSSSTALFLAMELPNYKLTVLTNSVQIINYLSAKDNINIICIGGSLLKSSMCFVGLFAQEAIKNYHVNKAFISSSGIYKNCGLTEPNEQAVWIKRNLLNISDQTYALMDSSKFGIKDLVQVCQLDKIDYLITDDIYPKDEILSYLGPYQGNLVISNG
jgi:DeoR/GlpR family transcriptional regulator of sugar metabolism